MRKVNDNIPARGQEGFVLVLTLLILLMLTLFGVWALNSSNSENRVASQEQQTQRIFNLNEGANYAEVSKIVHGRRSDLLVVKNPKIPNQVQWPDEDGFDPFDGSGKSRGLEAAKNLSLDDFKADPEYWPWENLEGDYGEHRSESDYRYLVTYLNCRVTDPGTDAPQFGNYKFRVQANIPGQNRVVESSVATVAYSCE